MHPGRQVVVGFLIVTLQGVCLGTFQQHSVGSQHRHHHLRIAYALRNIGVLHELRQLVHQHLGSFVHIIDAKVEVILRTPEASALHGLRLGYLVVVGVFEAHSCRPVYPLPVGVSAQQQQVGLAVGTDEGVGTLSVVDGYLAQLLPVAQVLGGRTAKHTGGVLDALVEVRLVVLHVVQVEAGGKGIGSLDVEMVFHYRVELVADHRQTFLYVGSYVAVKVGHGATGIDGCHLGEHTVDVRDAQVLIARLRAVSLTEDVAQHEVTEGTAHQGLAQLCPQVLWSSQLIDGKDDVVGGGNALVAMIPQGIRCVLRRRGDILPSGSLLLQRLEGGVGTALIIAVGIVAIHLAKHDARRHGIGTDQQVCDLLLVVQLCTVVGQHVEIIVASGKQQCCCHNAKIQQFKNVRIIFCHIFSFLHYHNYYIITFYNFYIFLIFPISASSCTA